MTLQNPFVPRHHRGADHLQGCGECAATVKREREYIQRLREASVPPASGDLTARLLARTELLAATPTPAPDQHPAVRVLALAAGGTAAAAGILAVSAFALAGDGMPLAATMNGSLVQHAAQLPADGRNLTDPQLAALRSEGWVCPDFETLGFHIRSANAVTLNGMPAVELHLSDGQHYATVVEQHPVDGAAKDGSLVVSKLAPWTATYETAAGRFTLESDLPADNALPVLQRLSGVAVEGIDAGSSAGPDAGQAAAHDESPAARLERGIRKMGEVLTR
ncbi:anti-sigma factor [Arthrobacter sp. UYCo732]|uniref:anti-sigma factor n=1 Tax=Arthrobacter sp. UYCo732 TaxID=3156336 RepID=UPI003398D147